jgi:3'-phosphoadenosine 5'-phosphosulfate (PAPS) 3'-phosphatase
MLVQQIQTTLIEDVRNKLSYYVELKWSNKMGTIHFYTKKHKLIEKVLDLSTNYTNYYKKDHKIEKIIIKEIKSNNPHIKINIEMEESESERYFKI